MFIAEIDPPYGVTGSVRPESANRRGRAGKVGIVGLFLVVLSACGSSDDNGSQARTDQDAAADAKPTATATASESDVPRLDCESAGSVAGIPLTTHELNATEVADPKSRDISCSWSKQGDSSGDGDVSINIGWDVPAIEELRATATNQGLTFVRSDSIDRLGGIVYSVYGDPTQDLAVRLPYRSIHSSYIELEQGPDGPVTLLTAAEKLSAEVFGD